MQGGSVTKYLAATIATLLLRSPRYDAQNISPVHPPEFAVFFFCIKGSDINSMGSSDIIYPCGHLLPTASTLTNSNDDNSTYIDEDGTKRAVEACH
jgi:hypothetical protein